MPTPHKVLSMQTKHLTKKEKMARQVAESKIKIDRKQLETGAPSWLCDGAAQEYNRVVREAGKIGLLDNLDMVVLAIYADNYARYVTASIEMRRTGLTVEGKFADVPSPYVAIADKAATQIQKCSTKLGLATTDRLKLIVPEKEEKQVNKFLKYLS